jgi:hypothetical protein
MDKKPSYATVTLEISGFNIGLKKLTVANGLLLEMKQACYVYGKVGPLEYPIS